MAASAGTRFLFVDDEPQILKSLRRMMRNFQAECVFVESGQAALAAFADEPFDVVVSDMRMPEMDGATLLAQIADQYPETIRLVLTGYSEESLIMSAINEGRIWGFIHKPWDDNQLLATLQQAMATQDLIAERALLKRTLARYNAPKNRGFEGFVGNSAPMQLVYSLIERVGSSNASVFITGPSGSGKEVAAQAIHNQSDRRDKPFIALNCAAIPADLMESEIFGHVKGAFSGAVSNRDGAAHQAHGGTLFLDELAEMDINLQAKLLRFIQTGQVQKVGATKADALDIRFVCATNRHPEEAIEQGLLREDLYYRLAVVTLDMPPLRLREGDPALLADHFLQLFAEQEKKAFAGFSQKAQQLLNHYRWPGNVRQLRNCIHNLVVMNEGPLITEQALVEALHLKPEQLDELLAGEAESHAPVASPAARSTIATAPPEPKTIRPLATVEREAIEHAIDHCEGNVVQAAAALGVSPSTLYRKLQAWEKANAST
ncbi:sigma-54-dependent transcriptional regulator [Simiduia agarivorans]|uniref:Response regulator receiver domain-containing protein n=1 Tax=Simiduia agarivorans (strain DSM 21679 / JCM 13881 / BCRC 17597 / SA1) TaxID=1117647 RepID=K4KNW2_SIMAS|nr:sigma-54 dependent transcriptional regulator [Simiduia agarivorans]AFU99798.1 response regulator receiver domain-containing protein [Simiduia agarivorans SA1 = DSM 21679]